MAPVQDRIPLNAEGNRENRSLLAEARTIGRKRDAHGRMKMGTLLSKQLFHGWSVGEQGTSLLPFSFNLIINTPHPEGSGK